MSRQRRNFSAKFKSDLVIELLKGEKDLNTLAVENNIQPNLLCVPLFPSIIPAAEKKAARRYAFPVYHTRPA